MEKITVGVIGTGMGRIHMEGYAKDSLAEILAICDLNKKEAEEFGEKYNAKYVFTDYKEMLKLEELDAVSIAVPNYLHAPISIDALEAGKNVLCEKPMATNLKDAKAMVDAAEKADDIDLDRAKSSLERANERLAKDRDSKNIDFFRAEAALKRAITRINVVEKGID